MYGGAEGVAGAHAVGLPHCMGVVQVALAVGPTHLARVVDHHGRVEGRPSGRVGLAHVEDDPQAVPPCACANRTHEGAVERLRHIAQLLGPQGSRAHEVLGEGEQARIGVARTLGKALGLGQHVTICRVAALGKRKQEVSHGVYSAQKTRPGLRGISAAGLSA